jgi:hypothetical protein
MALNVGGRCGLLDVVALDLIAEPLKVLSKE